MRQRFLMVGSFAAIVLLSAAAVPNPIIIWNVSESAPVGPYAVGGHADIAAGDMVIARVPHRWRALAAERHYIPINVPLVKRVAAEPGDTVCAIEQEIFVNGHRIAERRKTDGQRRPMPWWTGCATLRQGALFLLMDSPDSFDGRYFGVTTRDDVIGKARFLWSS